MHLRVLTGSGLGWALDAMDVGLISFIIAALAEQWSLQPGETAWIASVGFVGMAIGASVGGLLADRFGRRQVFAVTLLVYGLATGASALVGGLAALLVLRFLVGLGLGAELPVASTYVSEFAPARIRGRLIVILEAFWAVGWTAAALIGYLVIPASDNGWRWAFALGAIPAVYALVVRWGLPESARWLERRGRTREAEAVVALVRASRPGMASPADDRDGSTASPPAAASSAGSRLAALWSAEFRVRTACLWLVWFCVNFSYYGAFIWIPSILVAQGYDLVRSFGFTLIITLAQLPGLRRRGLAHRGVGPPADALGLPRRLGGLRRLLRHRRAPRPRSSPPAWRCRSSTSARGARCTRSHPRCTRPRCARPARAGRPASAASRRSSHRSPCRCCSAAGGAPAAVRRVRRLLRRRRGRRMGTRRPTRAGARRPLIAVG